jgi:glycosyltransferase involved in cell wall biosynthesis
VSLRVLFLINRVGVVGGAERLATALALHMPRDRIEPWVCSTREGDPRAIRSLAAAGVPHINLGRTAKWQVHRLADLIALVRRQHFDVLHAHMFGSNFWGTLIGRGCRVPVVLAHEHTWSYSDDPWRSWIDGRVIGRLATRFLAVSSADRERMITLEGINPEKAIVMPVPYIPHGGSRTSDIRAELGLDAGTPLIGVAAYMRKQKALDVMVEAHARLLATIPDAQLVMAGDGPCRAGLEAQIRRLGLTRSVHLLGIRDDVDSILRKLDVAAMSSDFEGTPLFALECMAAGTPLVATAVGGLREIITDGETGLLVPPRDPDALASAISRLLTDRSLAARLASRAAERCSEFKIAAVATRYADLYEQLLSEARR